MCDCGHPFSNIQEIVAVQSFIIRQGKIDLCRAFFRSVAVEEAEIISVARNEIAGGIGRLFVLLLCEIIPAFVTAFQYNDLAFIAEAGRPRP